MTFPITPLPAIHIDPTAAADAVAQARAALQSLQQMISQIGPQIIELLANAILDALGLSKFDGKIDDILTHLATAMQNIPRANITGLVSLVTNLFGSSTIGTLLQQSVIPALTSSWTGSVAYQNITAVLGTASLGEDVQGIVDKISNSLGQVGTGHTLANLLTYLAEIPHANITNVLGSSDLGADVQALVTSIVTGAATGAADTLAGLETSVSTIATAANTAADAIGDLITGIAGGGGTIATTVADLVATSSLATTLSTAHQGLLDAIANALGQSGTGHTVSQIESYLEAIPGSVISGATTVEQHIIDNIHQAVQGGSSTGNSVSDVKTQLQAMFTTLFGSGALGTLLTYAVLPNISIGGTANDIQTAVQDLVDNIHQAVAGGSGVGNAISDVKTQIAALESTASTVSSNFSALLSGMSAATVSALVTAFLNTASTANTASTNVATAITNIDNTLDAIANALGHSGTGHTPSQIDTYLGAIPYPNIAAILGSANLGADVQAVVDKIANALGNSGTGHTLANLLSYLGAIPYGNVTAVLGSASLGADIQAVVDKIANAMGQSGTGHTLANLLSYLEAIPGSNLTGSVAASLISGVTTNEQAIADAVYQATHGGSTTGNAISTIKTSLLAIPNANIAAILGGANLGADVQAVVDKISNAVGQSGTGHTLANLLSYLGSIPSGNIVNVLGGTNLGADVQAIVDKVSNGLGQSGTGHTLANLLTYLGAIPNTHVTAAAGSANLGADVQAVIDNIHNAVNALSTSGNAVTTIATDIAAIPSGIANVINSLTGNQSQSTANTAVGTLNSTLQANTLAIAAINTKLSGSTSNSGGLSVTVPFSGYSNSTSLPAIFTESYSTTGHGTLGITSGLAAWQTGSAALVRALAFYNVANTTSDYQVITATFAGAQGDGFTDNLLCGRANSAGTSYVQATLSSNFAYLTAIVAGAGTSFATQAITFNPSATYSLVCGNPSTSTLRQYQLLCNGTVVINYTDTSAVSQVGSSFRGSGFGMDIDDASGVQYAAAPMSQWTVSDNAPAPQVGSGFRQYRASTTPVTVSGSAGAVSGWNDGLIASSFFDTSQQQTSDLTYASGTNNKITVSVAGWYAVSISALVAVTGSTSGFCFLLYRNGSSADRDVAINNAAFTGVWRGKFQVYCAAGDTLQPGISYFGTAPTIKGDSGGTTTAFEVCLLNCGTLS